MLILRLLQQYATKQAAPEEKLYEKDDKTDDYQSSLNCGEYLQQFVEKYFVFSQF